MPARNEKPSIAMCRRAGYVFHVMACNSDSVWSDDSALLAVTVNPFFYQTAWFRRAQD